MANLNELPHKQRKRSTELPPELLAEWGDTRDVRVTFGFRPTFLYYLFCNGKVRGVLVPGARGKRGKRLFSYASIRSYLQHCEEQELIAGDPNRAGIASQHTKAGDASEASTRPRKPKVRNVQRR